MKLGRLLAVAGLGYGAYRWLRSRPQTMGKVKGAIREVGSAARQGDLDKARTALTGLGDAIGEERSVRQVVDKVQDVVTQLGTQVKEVLAAVAGRPEAAADLQLDATAAAAIVPICATLVQVGRLATERGTTQAIRQVGERLAVQFDQLGSQLRETVGDMPQGPDEPGSRLVAHLQDLAGQPFDIAAIDEGLNAITRLQAGLPAQAGGLAGRLHDLTQALREIATQIHGRETAMPGPGTTEALEREP